MVPRMPNVQARPFMKFVLDKVLPEELVCCTRTEIKCPSLSESHYAFLPLFHLAHNKLLGDG